MEPGPPVVDADDELELDDSEEELPGIEDAPDVDPIEVASHSEGDRDP
jgi:hypothetical protein